VKWKDVLINDHKTWR